MKDTAKAKALRLAIYKRALKLLKNTIKISDTNTNMVGFCYTMHWARKAYQSKYGKIVPEFNSKSSVESSAYPELSAYKPSKSKLVDAYGNDFTEIEFRVYWYNTILNEGIAKRIEIFETIIAKMSKKKL